jgi:acyl carrier protein
MQPANTSTIEQVKSILVTTLGVEDRAPSIDASTPLLGGLPEMDSLAVVELVATLEARFDITIDDDDITTDTFQTLDSLTTLIDDKLRAASPRTHPGS